MTASSLLFSLLIPWLFVVVCLFNFLCLDANSRDDGIGLLTTPVFTALALTVICIPLLAVRVRTVRRLFKVGLRVRARVISGDQTTSLSCFFSTMLMSGWAYCVEYDQNGVTLHKHFVVRKYFGRHFDDGQELDVLVDPSKTGRFIVAALLA